MPLVTIDQLRTRESKLAAEIADKKDVIGQADMRALRKKLRRAQRKRRRLGVTEAKHASAAAKKSGGEGESAEAASE